SRLNLRDDRRLGVPGQCEWPTERRDAFLKLGHVIEEFPSAAIEVALTAAAAQGGAHLVGDMAVEAGCLKGLEERGIVDETLAERYGPDYVRLPDVVDKVRLIAKTGIARVIGHGGVDNI